MELDATRTQTRRLMRSVTVNRPAVRLYQAWRDLSRRQTAPGLNSRVAAAGVPLPTIKAPGIAETGMATTGMAELSLEIPGLLIAWKSLPYAELVQAGEVWFSPLPQDQAEVRLILTWQDRMDSARQRSSGHETSTEAQVELDLMRFKQLMEG
jgi:uncharacterized membrane protein